MAIHIEKGKEGERLAVKYLERNNYTVEFCNWRYKNYEIDIVATKGGVIHFIEVKTRYNTTFGFPEDAVSKKKFESLKNAGVAFQNKYPLVKNIQFDILSITRSAGKDEYFLLEDVYF